MIRKKFIQKEKEIFKVKYNYLGDLDFVLRFSLKYKFAAVQECIGVYRQHNNQMQKKTLKLNQYNLVNGIMKLHQKKYLDPLRI